MGTSLAAQETAIPSTQPTSSATQDSSFSQAPLHIADILIIGNKRTREYVIRREMSLEEGQVMKLPELEDKIAESKKRLLNTRLFLSIRTLIDTLAGNHVRVMVEVKERWYVVPMPVFKLADRNFNDWWTNQNRDLSRVNYGLRFSHYNFMGRAEKLSVWAQFGYTRSFRLGYYMPYIDKNRKTGLGINVLYYDNNNLAFRTVSHKRVFLNYDAQELRKTYVASLGLTRRASFYTTSYAGGSFVANTFADTVLSLNPEYLPVSKKNIRYFSAYVGVNKDRRDNVSYALKGYQLGATLTKTGLGIFDQVNILELETRTGFYKPLTGRLYWANLTTARVSYAKKQPYYLMTGLGYGIEYVRGMELYVLEGLHHILNKTELKWQLFDKVFNLSKLIPFDQFNKIPIALYPKVYFDAAYVMMPDPMPENNFLVNRPIWGLGAGLDVVSFYDFAFKLEYSMNSLRERGVFFHMNKGF